jgi:ABC-type bacteriocin/lantibiotic exporter with double-glycine peptidase domain
MSEIMNEGEFQEIAPGLSKIRQALGDANAQNESVFDKKSLFRDALYHYAEIAGITLEMPSSILHDDIDISIERISIYSGVRIQKINLENKWWEDDLGIILGFLDGVPAVLVPKTYGGYKRYTPSGMVSLTADQLSQVSNYGYTFTKPLPEKIDRLTDLAKYTFKALLPKLRLVFYLQFFLSIVLMSLPVAISFFFNHFDEFVAHRQATILGIILIINSLVYFFLSLMQSIALLHLQFKTQIYLEPAIWDRLLKLTPSFFHQYNSGSIAYRARVVSNMQELLTPSAILSLFSVIIAVISFGLMCYYNVQLALLALAGFFVIAPMIFFTCLRSLRYQHKVYDYLTKQSGFVFQVINSILKFKVSANESRAFNLWSDYFSKLVIARYKAEKVQISLRIVNGTLLIFMTFILFCVYVYSDHNLSFGSFIAFNAAFAQFFTALLAMVAFVSSIIAILPLFKQSQVIYQEKIDSLQHTGSQLPLEGKIKVKNLSFRYDPSLPLIFKNISLSIRPGEIIGITGASGCGKSTLFRILLGLEKPLGGQIFYDDINMDMINLTNLRQQMGVVTQRSVLTPGTILENIIGNNTNLTRKDAWDIVYKLGIEQMIMALPMDMETIITEGMQTLSRGEQQRIVLARALIKKPKILLMDEATSALDAQNQAKIQSYLSQLKITQIIIAHRLSTLKNADRILVIADGKIAQEGTFDQLVKVDGHFAELAKYQFGNLNGPTN